MAAGASPRASSRPTTPGPLGPAGLVSPSTEALEKRLRAARKKLRQIEKLMTKPVAELNHQQQEKLIKHTETAEAVRQLEGELAAALHDPADSPANVEKEGALGSACICLAVPGGRQQLRGRCRQLQLVLS